jgi:hyperosmotically inducible protein
MNVYKNLAPAGMLAFLTVTSLSLASICHADDSGSMPTGTNGANQVAADNSGQNRDQNSITAEQQGNSPADINITKEIRRSVERNDNLSEMAKNVKIITINGAVTLRGPVKTMEEKNTIEQIAQKVAGESNVHNQLDVKNNQ